MPRETGAFFYLNLLNEKEIYFFVFFTHYSIYQ